MNSFPKKKYVTTALAGFWVAGKKIPSDIKDGKLVPKVGHSIQLTELEAKYELAAGNIELAAAAVEPASKKSPKAD